MLLGEDLASTHILLNSPLFLVVQGIDFAIASIKSEPDPKNENMLLNRTFIENIGSNRARKMIKSHVKQITSIVKLHELIIMRE